MGCAEMFDVDAEGPGHYFLLTCQSSSPSASRPRFESLNSAKIQGETLPEAEFMHKPHCILIAFAPYFVGYAWGIYREFGHRNSATVCLKFWGKKINLWMEAQIFMVSPNHWISTFIEQQSLWHHAFYTPLCPKPQHFHLGDILLPLHYIPGRDADGLASHPKQKLASSQTHEIYSNYKVNLDTFFSSHSSFFRNKS